MEDGADTVIDGIVEVVGSNGTVIAPTFALLAPSGAVRLMALPAELPLTVGVISEALRCRPGAQRSFHPFYIQWPR